VIDKSITEKGRLEIEVALGNLPVQVEIVTVDFFRYGIHPELKVRRRLGDVIHELLKLAQESDAFMLVAPNERLFSNHLAVLAGALQRDPTVHCAATAAVLVDGGTPVHTVHETLDFGHVNRQGPCGYARFIFRTNAIPQDIGVALPYLDGRPLAVMVGANSIAQQLPASVSIDLRSEYPPRAWDDAAENEVIRDFSPHAFVISSGRRVFPSLPGLPSVGPVTQPLSRLLNRRWIGAQLHAIRKQGLSARLQVLRRKLGGAP
jgi:hypothetical protein